MSERILIVEDEDKIADVLRDYLVQHGYATHRFTRGDEALDWMREHPVDLVLLDLMLPGMNGLDVCKRIRETSSAAVIMVTARVEEIDRLLGLELGADDYVCKPFSPREVVARVKAVLRRTKTSGSGSASPADGHALVMDDDGWRALLEGRDLLLTAVEFQLLKVMVAQPGRIFSREQLMDSMYRDTRVVADRTVDSHIKKLRRKIHDVSPEREIIHSVYGVGYKFEP